MSSIRFLDGVCEYRHCYCTTSSKNNLQSVADFPARPDNSFPTKVVLQGSVPASQGSGRRRQKRQRRCVRAALRFGFVMLVKETEGMMLQLPHRGVVPFGTRSSKC